MQAHSTILSALLSHAEDIFPGCPASILLLDEHSRRLRHGASHGLPGFYNQAIDGLEIGPNVGSCGAAAYTRRQMVVNDIETHPNWAPYVELARKAGLRACWSEPIPSSTGLVLGTFAIYAASAKHPRSGRPATASRLRPPGGIGAREKTGGETLRKAEFELNRAQAVAQVGSWSLDVAEDRLVWSEETYRIFCKPPGSPLSYRIFVEAVHPDDRALVHQAWTAALRGGRYAIEHRILTEGETKWVRENAEIELDARGRPRGVGTVQDITKRKTSELALQASEEHRLKARKSCGGWQQASSECRRSASEGSRGSSR